MRQLAGHFLRLVMIAVAIGASSVSAYASVLEAFDLHAHGPHGLHAHASDHAGHDHGAAAHDIDVAADDGSSGHDPNPSDQPCKHSHMHCCSSFAVPAGDDYGLRTAVYDRSSAVIVNSLIPHGQIASPLYRPPRAAA